MQPLTNAGAALFVPDGLPEETALPRITHLGIGAHPDDLEFMALHGILACYRTRENWFGGVTCTDGAGCARAGAFASCTDDEMRAVRRSEQNKAAEIGAYGAMLQLDYGSGAVKDPTDRRLEKDLLHILKATRPEVVYAHNPADKHDTHVAVFSQTLGALRALPPGDRPRRVLGCEVWRGLDWMLDDDKVPLNVSGHPELVEALHGAFASQIAGGKRYDLATIGRQRANATFFHSHRVDEARRLAFAMDLTPLVVDPGLDEIDYVAALLERLADDVRRRLGRFLAP